MAGEGRARVWAPSARFIHVLRHPLTTTIKTPTQTKPNNKTNNTKQGIRYSAELLELVSQGVAYHSTDLTSDERLLVEEAFACGAVSVLAATSTLAAGVNLPVRRVIFKHAYIGIRTQMLTPTKFRQMCGRAGRKGIDDRGEAVLLADPSAAGAASVARLAELLRVSRGFCFLYLFW